MRPPMKGFGGRQLTFDITQIQNSYGTAGVQTFLGSATMKPRLGVRHAGYPDLCNEKIKEQPPKMGRHQAVQSKNPKSSSVFLMQASPITLNRLTAVFAKNNCVGKAGDLPPLRIPVPKH